MLTGFRCHFRHKVQLRATRLVLLVNQWSLDDVSISFNLSVMHFISFLVHLAGGRHLTGWNGLDVDGRFCLMNCLRSLSQSVLNALFLTGRVFLSERASYPWQIPSWCRDSSRPTQDDGSHSVRLWLIFRESRSWLANIWGCSSHLCALFSRLLLWYRKASGGTTWPLNLWCLRLSLECALRIWLRVGARHLASTITQPELFRTFAPLVVEVDLQSTAQLAGPCLLTFAVLA